MKLLAIAIDEKAYLVPFVYASVVDSSKGFEVISHVLIGETYESEDFDLIWQQKAVKDGDWNDSPYNLKPSPALISRLVYTSKRPLKL